MKPPAYLIGPFVGELSWEFFRFAPYVIHMKKEHPEIPMIVFTRQSRFDLYGVYADTLVPLRIPNDEKLSKKCFTIDSLLTREYNQIARVFASKYKRQYQILKHIYPDISTWRYKLKWQFPRRKMDYNFTPRRKNKKIARSIIKHNNILIDRPLKYSKKISEAIYISHLYDLIDGMIDNYETTSLGVLIECLKICHCVVGNLKSNISQLSLLLKTPLICINNELSIDSINLINPLNTKIIYENDILRGIEKYEKVM